MKIDIQKIDTYKKEELEKFHDETHVIFNKLLSGEKVEYTIRELHYLHQALHQALVRAGGVHVSPVDQLDRIQMLEKNKKEKEKKEFILLRYLDSSGVVDNLWAIQLGKKIFELELNPLMADTLYSIKKNINAKGDILDKGRFEVLTDNKNLLSVEFKGKHLQGVYNFKRNGTQSDVWKLLKDGTKEKLSENTGESLSKREINSIFFLSSNKIGASEVSNLIERPVQTVYNWIRKMGNELTKKK